MLRWSIVVVTLSSITSVAGAPKVALTPEQAVHFRRISDLHFSPDGKQLACVVGEAPDPEPSSHIWLADVATQSLRRITWSAKSETSPRWSPDGKTLAFLSARDGESQIYVLAIDGGEATKLTALEEGVDAYVWSPDGKQLAVLSEKPSKKPPNDAHVFDREETLDQIWIVDRATKQVKQLTSVAYRIDELTWPAADHLTVVAHDHPRSETWNTAIFRVAVADGRMTKASSPAPPFGGIVLSPAGRSLAYVGTATGGPIPHDVFVDATDVTKRLDRAVLEVHWQNEDTLVARVVDGFETPLYRVPVRGTPTRIDVPTSVRAFDIARDGTLAYVGVGFTRLPELHVILAGSPPLAVGRVQDPAWDNVALVEPSRFRVKSFDGLEIEAALFAPPQATGKRPLVVLVHGGPSSAFTADYFWFNAWPQLLAARGYYVLLPNPRGSTGYGEAFVKANRGDWGGGDYKDIMATVDFAIAHASIDPARLAIGGWSYGGEMTAWAIGHTTKFRAAVVGGGVFDQAAEFETENGPAGDEWHFGTPWNNPDVFARNSPVTHIAKAKTPTLIVHGEADRNNPVGQAHGLYRALKALGVETQLVTYPGEGHVPRMARHQRDIMERMLAWYDAHLR